MCIVTGRLVRQRLSMPAPEWQAPTYWLLTVSFLDSSWRLKGLDWTSWAETAMAEARMEVATAVVFIVAVL